MAYFKEELLCVLISFVLGFLGGFLIDIFGVKMAKLWKYPRQKFLSPEYFRIVLPAWGVFSMAINLTWEWFFGNFFIAVIIITLILFAIHELPNVKTHSWKYYTPTWLVILGWPPLIIVFRYSYIFLFFLIL